MVKCVCKGKMELAVKNNKVEVWECPQCFRLLVRHKMTGYQSWYRPETK